MDVLDAIRSRRSISRLSSPAPNDEELKTILEAATCAPDHGCLRPWRFVVLAGPAKDAFGPVLAQATVADHHDRGLVPEPAKVEKDRTKMSRGPLVVVVACRYVANPKIPRHEQYAAVVAATQNACLAATALGYGSMWRTGPNADNRHVKRSLGLFDTDDIVGFLYLGKAEPASFKPGNTGDLRDVVTRWKPTETSPTGASPTGASPTGGRVL